MNLREQKYVSTLAQTGSITGAAKILGISQPTLSIFISNLEENMGIKLFDRIGKRFYLTHAGELYVDAAREMLDINSRFSAALSNIVDNMHGRVRIGIQNFRSSRILAAIYREFTQTYPNIELEIYELTLGELRKLLDENKIDIFFCNCPNRNPAWEHIPLLQDQVLFIASPDHPKAELAASGLGKHPWINLKAFEDETFIMPYPGASLRSYADQVLAANQVKPKHIICLRKIESITELVGQGVGVGFCAESYDNYMRLSHTPKYFSVGVTPMMIEFSAVYPKGKPLPAYTQHLITMIQNAIN